MLANKLIKGGGGAATPTDPQFPYVTMLLHGDGTNGAQNNTFLDASTNNFTITRNGNTTQGSFSPYGDNWSNYFVKASTSYLLTPLNGFAGNFTIEAWIYPLSNDTTIYSGGGSAVHEYFMVRGGGTNIEVELQSGYGGANYYPVQGFNLLNRWTHVALVRSGSTVKCYFDGVASATTMSMAASAFPTSSNKIGTYSANPTGYGFDGYISNLRVFDATAFYTSDFTPPTAPLTAIAGTSLLTCQSNRFKDASANNFTITANGDTSVQRFSPFAPTAEYSASVIGGSGYFDGTGDYLTYIYGSELAFGTGDFTVEWWQYSTDTSSGILQGDVNAGWGIALLSGTFYWQSVVNTTNKLTASVSAYLTNSWNHWAVVRASSTLKLYINGTEIASVSDTTNYSDSSGTMNIGYYPANGNYLLGYLSNLRIVKGTAVYTSAFTPPTAPLTAVTNTSLLLNFTNAGIYDNAMMNDLETVGNAQVSTSVKKFGTGSIYLDGSGDSLNIASTPNLAFGTGDFTVECWIYSSTLSSQQGALFTNGASGGLYIYVDVGQITVRVFAVVTLITAGTLTNNAWNHVAVTRSGTSVRLFINGTQAGSTATSSQNFVQAPTYIGTENGSSTTPYSGYIDDLRVTKGYARYTANFTPPTAAFPNQ